MTSFGNWTVAKPNLETDLFEPCNYLKKYLFAESSSKIEIDGILP